MFSVEKKIRTCEYYSFKEKKIYKLPDLNMDRANASYIVSIIRFLLSLDFVIIKTLIRIVSNIWIIIRKINGLN